jgi:hypothetical protein
MRAFSTFTGDNMGVHVRGRHDHDDDCHAVVLGKFVR